jgi:hypothetical protein
MNEKADKTPLELTGLDGANPLGFLAALGTLVVCHQAGETKARLGWRRSTKWTPVLEDVSTTDPEALSGLLSEFLRGEDVAGDAENKRESAQKEFDKAKKAVKDKREEIKKRRLRGNERKEAFDREVKPLQEVLSQKRQEWLETLKHAVSRPELAIGKHIDCQGDEFREHANRFLSDTNYAEREVLDLLTNFGSDACTKQKSDRIEATWLCFITGSGHQYFLDTARQLMDKVNQQRVYAALFKPWAYQDEILSMRWDPMEDRRYALMDRDPTASGNKPRTVWMANLLAYRALALFPSAPTRNGLVTTGWSRFGDDLAFTWPIWVHAIGPDAIRSLLQSPELSMSEPSEIMLRAQGVTAVFRARRLQVGNPPLHKINFSPARSV